MRKLVRIIPFVLVLIFTTPAFATTIGTDISVSGNLTVAGNSTTTNATTTDFYVSGVASTTSLYSTGLISCSGASNALTWSGGIFGCNTISGSGNTYSSTTIGDSTQIGGLTISGGATTTGNAYFKGNVQIGTTTFYTMPTIGTAALTIGGPLAIEASSSDSTGAPNVLGIINTATAGYSDVGFIQSKSSAGNSALDFMDNNGNIMGAVGYTNTTGSGFITNQKVYISASPPFSPPSYQEANSGVGSFVISQEGVYNGSYGERAAYEVNNDWGIQIQDPLGNVMASFASPLSSSGNFGYGANEFKIVGTNAYKYSGSPGTNGGASAQFTAVNSDGDAVVVGSFPSQMNYNAYPPHGGGLSAYGSGGLSLFAANGSGKIRFYTAGDSSGNQRMVIDSSGNVGIGQASPNAKLDVNSSSIIIESSATPSLSSDTCTTGQIEWDSSYIYVCVSANTWKRSALTTW